jgi:hypothetical protein
MAFGARRASPRTRPFDHFLSFVLTFFLAWAGLNHSFLAAHTRHAPCPGPSYEPAPGRPHNGALAVGGRGPCRLVCQVEFLVSSPTLDPAAGVARAARLRPCRCAQQGAGPLTRTPAFCTGLCKHPRCLQRCVAWPPGAGCCPPSPGCDAHVLPSDSIIGWPGPRGGGGSAGTGRAAHAQSGMHAIQAQRHVRHQTNIYSVPYFTDRALHNLRFQIAQRPWAQTAPRMAC